MTKLHRVILIVILGSVVLLMLAEVSVAPMRVVAQAASTKKQVPADFAARIDNHCVGCHNPVEKKGGFDLEAIIDQEIAENAPAWEKVLRKMNTRQMPPPNWRRPSEKDYQAMAGHLAQLLDAAAARNPDPGRTETFRHLNRTEYQNAIRDLLALEIDAAELLPPDESSHGFDHITVSTVSTALMKRYVQAAQTISKRAIGTGITEPEATIYRIPADVTQEQRVEGLPLGTRGGAMWRHTFPRDGEYEIQVRLTRDRDEFVEGLHGKHQLEVLVDRAVAAQFEIAPPKKRAANHYDDSKLNARFKVSAGPHDVGVTFIDNGNSLQETRREPLNVHFNAHRHPRLTPAVYQVSIIGPFASSEPKESRPQTPSRQRIFTSYPKDADEEEQAAKEIVSTLARRAYRRPIDETDLAKPMRFFDTYREQGGFEAGIEMALSAILTSPHFLFKIERDPEDVEPGEAYRISEFELASRLSFFLWSSIPDDALLDAAERGDLSKPDVLEAQVRRMLADEKADNLATNFASQWLHLRNMDDKTPDARLFPDFDDNLRQAMRRETELLFLDMVRHDRSVMDLIRADDTFLNERLAKHYGIPHVYGSRFRRVDLPEDAPRGGLLRQGSILTVTSYATRTSPVVRGNWVLENILGTPAPPPPEDVPSLEMVDEPGLSVRQRLARHREDPSCAQCHRLMDPVGFSLERFDVVGRWREMEAGQVIDAAGGLPDGSKFVGVDGLESAILKRPSVFATALTEKLLTFAVGRGVEYEDGSAVRRIVSQAEASDYRFSSIVLEIVKSQPFQMRRAQ